MTGAENGHRPNWKDLVQAMGEVYSGSCFAQSPEGPVGILGACLAHSPQHRAPVTAEATWKLGRGLWPIFLPLAPSPLRKKALELITEQWSYLCVLNGFISLYIFPFLGF